MGERLGQLGRVYALVLKQTQVPEVLDMTLIWAERKGCLPKSEPERAFQPHELVPTLTKTALIKEPGEMSSLLTI